MKNATLIARDPSLPSALGDSFRPPGTDELAALVSEHLAGGAVQVVDCEWSAARWKPGVSLACTYALRTASGEEHWVAWKSYAGHKGHELAQRELDEPEAIGAWAHRAFLADGHTVLTHFPHDPRLPGLADTTDLRKSARFVEDWGLALPRTVRRRRTEDTLIRYKPERRAVLERVFHVRAPSRVSVLRLGWRVLVPEAAERAARARLLFESVRGSLPTPMLRAALPDLGILVEDWLEAEVLEHDDFSAARQTGELLGRLHTLPLPGLVPDAAAYDPAQDEEILSLATGTGERRVVKVPTVTSQRSWVHGDLHPDHLAHSPAGDPLLLDLDELGAGDPARDLASWIADRLAAEAHDPESDVAQLLAGYESSSAECPREELARWIQAELHARAAGAVRRLEANAPARAAQLLAIATDSRVLRRLA